MASSDELEQWLTRCMFGRKPAGSPPSDQLQELNDILCRFEVGADFEDIDMKLENSTRVELEIKPRAITDRSVITLRGVQGYSECRALELFGTSRDWRVGQSGWGDKELRVWELDPKDITRKDGRITAIRVALCFRMDTDEVRGRATLELRNGTLQGFSRTFTVKA
jgi:hypothetical protein